MTFTELMKITTHDQQVRCSGAILKEEAVHE